MHPTVDILDSMIDNLMCVVGCETVIREQEVSVEGRTGLDMLPYLGLQDGLATARDDARTNLPAALKNAHDGNLVFGASSGDAAVTDAHMHVSRLAADKGFICFYFAATPADLEQRAVLHGETDAMEHEPCRLLSDAQSAGQLAGRNAILAVGDNPDGGKPLLKSKGRIFEDGAHLGGELASRVRTLALPLVLLRKEGYIVPPASRADDAVLPPMRHHVLAAVDRIGEVDNSFLKCARAFHNQRIEVLS